MSSGEVELQKILSDEQVEPGEQILTSGGDQIFPKGLPAGTVVSVSQGPEAFLNIRIRTAARLSKLEEVLVITQQEAEAPVAAGTAPMRAADVLAQRLPSVPDHPAAAVGETPDGGAQPSAPAAGKPNGTNQTDGKATAASPSGVNQKRPESAPPGTTRPQPTGSTPAENLPGTPKAAPSAAKAPGNTPKPAAPASTPPSTPPGDAPQ